MTPDWKVQENTPSKSATRLNIKFTVAYSPAFGNMPTYISIMPGDLKESMIIEDIRSKTRTAKNFLERSKLTKHFETVQKIPQTQAKYLPVDHTPEQLAENYLILKELQKLAPDSDASDFDLS